MMRRQFITGCSASSLLSIAVFLWLCAACTQADIVVPVTGQTEKDVPLSVKSLDMSVEVESRSVVTGGPEETDKNPNPLRRVGLFVTRMDDGSVYDSSNPAQAFSYYPVDKTWGKESGYAPVLLSADKATVYAFSPVADNAKNVTATGEPPAPLLGKVKVLAEQTFDFASADPPADVATDAQWQTDQDDYFYGTAKENPDRWNPEVHLTVSHALAKLSFRILEADGGSYFTGRSVKKVILEREGGFQAAPEANASLNLQTGELTGTTAADSLTFEAGTMRAVGTGIAEAEVATVPIQAFGLVVPEKDASVTLKLRLDDGRLFTIKPGADPTTTTTWEKGKNYIYTIRMSPQGVTIADVQVADWAAGGEEDVPVVE